MLVGLDIGIAAKRRPGAEDALLGRGQLLLGLIDIVPGLIQRRFGVNALAGKVGGPVILRLRVVDLTGVEVLLRYQCSGFSLGAPFEDLSKGQHGKGRSPKHRKIFRIRSGFQRLKSRMKACW
ncbi:hypothetical protein [Mesorhizobium sp. f-mel]